MSAQVLFEKLANGQALTALEKTEMVMIGRGLDEASATIKGWTVPNTQNAFLKNPRIENPFWKTSPLHTLFVERHTNVSIANSTDTDVQWETQFGENTLFSVNPGNAARIDLKITNIPFNIGGIFSFAANATGYRNMKLSSFDKNDVLIGTATLASVPGFAAADLVQPFFYPATAAQNSAMTWFKITVAQGSGAGLNLMFFDMGISIG